MELKFILEKIGIIYFKKVIKSQSTLVLMEKVRLVVNESYWNLFSGKDFRNQDFIIPSVNNLKKEQSMSTITRDMGLIFQNLDIDCSAVYGIEIKTNGSSRSARIPLMRYTKNNQTIWKFIKDIKSMDKGIVDLEELEYHLKSSLHENNFPLPYKVLVLLEPENKYVSNALLSDYIKNKVAQTKIIFISFDFIKGLLVSKIKLNFDDFLSEEGIVYTVSPLNGSNN